MNYTQSEEYLFNTMPVGRAIASLAVPTVISQIITVIYNMADTFFVGQLGDPNQVAAATVALPLFIFITALANLFGVGGASLISRCLGQGDRQKAGHTAAFCIWSAIAVSLIYGIAVLLLRPVLLPLLGADAETFGYSSSYVLYSIGLGAMPAALNPMLAHLVRAEGHSRQASLGVAFGGILNILLDPFFIFVLDLEIAGAGIATLLSNLAAAGYFTLFLHKIRHETAITISPRQYTLGQHIPGEVLSVGLPSCLISVMGAISNTVLNHFTSGYSNAAMAGMGIAKKVNLLAFAVGQGITQGTLPLIGYNYTSGNRQRMLKAIYGLLVGCLAVSLLITILLYFGATPITRWFINDAETVSHGCTFLQIICLTCPTSTFIFFAITVFQATGKRAQPIFLSLVRKGTTDVLLMPLFYHLIGINGVEGLLHISDISWKKIGKVEDVLKPDQVIDVKIKSFDREKQRISFSHKDCLPNPWETAVTNHAADDIVDAKVVKILEFGVIVELEDGLTGLLHINEMTDDHNKKPGDICQVGDDLKVRIINIDEGRRRISFSLVEAPVHDAPEEA